MNIECPRLKFNNRIEFMANMSDYGDHHYYLVYSDIVVLVDQNNPIAEGSIEDSLHFDRIRYNESCKDFKKKQYTVCVYSDLS